MPAHNHSASTTIEGQHNHSLTLERYRGREAGDDAGWGGDQTALGLRTQTTTNAGAHSHTISINNTGSNQPHNNLQPYCVCYIWKRTA